MNLLLQTLLFIMPLWSEGERRRRAKTCCVAVGRIRVSTRQASPQTRIRIRQGGGEAVPRRRTAQCPGLLHYLVCFLCFLAVETGPGDGAWNSLPDTSLRFSSFLYLSRSPVGVLWVLTDFWSLTGTPTDANHQLSNARLFDKSHY